MHLDATTRLRHIQPFRRTMRDIAIASALAVLAILAIVREGAAADSSAYRTLAGMVTISQPVSDYRFLEMNLHLPGPSIAATNWKLIEDNQWGADFVFESPAPTLPYPTVDDVPQLRHRVTIY